MIAEWKAKWGAVYSLSASGIEFIFRPLTLAEINEFDEVEDEELIIKRCLLSPQDIDLDQLPAGVVFSLSQEIVSFSIGSEDSLAMELARARENVTTVPEQLKVVILAAFPTYTEKDISDFTLPKLVHEAVLAEEVLKLKQQLDSGGSIDIQFAQVGAPDKPRDSVRERLQEELDSVPASPQPNDPIARALHAMNEQLG